MKQIQNRRDSRIGKFFVVLSPNGAPVAKLAFMTFS